MHNTAPNVQSDLPLPPSPGTAAPPLRLVPAPVAANADESLSPCHATPLGVARFVVEIAANAVGGSLLLTALWLAPQLLGRVLGLA